MRMDLETMLRSFPTEAPNPQRRATAIEALLECSLSCTMCADACQQEQDVQALSDCVKMNLQCADACLVTARSLARSEPPGHAETRLILEACLEACRACAAECERYARHMEHCRMCAEVCRRCEQACEDMLEHLSEASTGNATAA